MSTTQNTRRTRLGKVVGSYRAPLEGFTYSRWDSSPTWYVLAPSGARLTAHETMAEAAAEAARRQAEWEEWDVR